MGSNLRNTNGTPKPIDVFTKQIRIAELAKEDSKHLRALLDQWVRDRKNHVVTMLLVRAGREEMPDY